MRGQQTLWTEFGKPGTPSLFDNAVSFEDAAGTVTPIEVTVKAEPVEDAWRELAAEIEANESATRYDYVNQAWILNGRYESCAHPKSMGCT